MNSTELRSQILMLRNHRAQTQLKTTALLKERTDALREIAKLDLTIAGVAAIAADLDVQVAEHMVTYTEMLLNESTPKDEAPSRPLGPNGALLTVHPTTAYVYDKFMRDGHFHVKMHSPADPTGRRLQLNACDLIVRAGLAYTVGNRSGDYSIMKQPAINPVAMPDPK